MKFFDRIYLKAVLFAVVAAGGCRMFPSPAANSVEINASPNDIKRNKSMTINFGRINLTVPNGFPVPAGYEDAGSNSEYEKAAQFATAKNAEPEESLEAGWEFESDKSLEALNAEVKDNMENADLYAVGGVSDQTIDGFPAKIIRATAKYDGEPSAQVFVMHIKSGEKKFVRVYYETQAAPADAQATFDRVAASITFNRNGGKPKTPTAEKFKRYDAGDLSLDVPTAMSPKQASAEKTLRIEQLPEENWNTEQIVYTVSCFDADNIKTKTDPVKQIEMTQAPDAVTSRTVESFDTDDFEGEITRLSLTVPELESPEGKIAVLIAEGRTKDQTTVQMKGESPFSKRSEMESGFRELLNSIKTPE